MCVGVLHLIAMPNQRSKNKTHFTASAENDLKRAIEIYAAQNDLDRNTALRDLLWQSVESARIAETPAEFRVEVQATQEKNRAKKKKSRKK